MGAHGGSAVQGRRPRHGRLVLAVLVGLAAAGTSAVVAVEPSRASADTVAMPPEATPVIMVHGLSLASCPGTDVTHNVWGGVYLQLFNSGWAQQSLLPVSFYQCDTNGVDITGYGPTPPEGATPTITPDPPRVPYTADTSIKQIAHDLAWFVYDTYASAGLPVDLVGGSLGGLIIRYAMYRVEDHDPQFPPYLIVPRIVTLSTPHAGYLTLATIGSYCSTPRTQCDEAATDSPFMTDLTANALNPQGAGGTAWTVVGSSEGCDFVPASSALAMPDALRIDYAAPCYGHADYLWDFETSDDATMKVTDPGTAPLTDGVAPHSLTWIGETLRDAFVPVAAPPSEPPSSSTPTTPSPSPSSSPPSPSPSVALIRPATLFQASRSVTVSYAGNASAVRYDVRYRAAPWTGGFGTYQYPSSWQGRTGTSLTVTGAAGREYCYAARARSAAGQVSAWSAQRCVTVPLDDRALAAVTAGWRRVSSASAYLGTMTRTSTRGARLRIRGVHTDQVALIVVECPTCGKVGIYLNGSHWRAVDTRATTTRRRVILVQPQFSTRTTTITLADADGRQVIVDGLAVAH